MENSGLAGVSRDFRFARLILPLILHQISLGITEIP
jgi:hypothetical protein